jgi:hypothetical protein
MKQPHVCKLTGEASILVAGRAGIMIGPGTVLDFAEELVPAKPKDGKTPAQPALTVREALGELAASFEPLDQKKKAPEPSPAIAHE